MGNGRFDAKHEFANGCIFLVGVDPGDVRTGMAPRNLSRSSVSGVDLRCIGGRCNVDFLLSTTMARGLVGALAVATTVNGFAFGASHGFLPQTWGLAFAASAFGFRGLEMGLSRGNHRYHNWRTGVPLGICMAASMHCYWDLLPLEVPAMAFSYLVPWPGWNLHELRNKWRSAWIPGLTCLLLVNLEWFRAAKGILLNVTAVVANPVAWNAWDFPAHVLGLKSSIWERSSWITHDPPAGALFAGCLAMIGWGFVMITSETTFKWNAWLKYRPQMTRQTWQPLTPLLVWITLTSLLFLYFRYIVPSPWHGRKYMSWPDGVGQSWSQYS